jgi:hypothetical protein
MPVDDLRWDRETEMFGPAPQVQGIGCLIPQVPISVPNVTAYRSRMVTVLDTIGPGCRHSILLRLAMTTPTTFGPAPGIRVDAPVKGEAE